MSRSDWGELTKAGGLSAAVALFCVWLWVDNVPNRPNLPRYQYGDPPQGNYYPGGTACKPEVLSRLTGKEALSERDRCAQNAEDHRHDSDDLAQQTRAADAASASAIYAFEQTKLMLVGALVAIVTLIAAVFAAIYARKAFLTQEHSFKLLARPFLYLEKVKAKELATDYFDIEVRVQNSGASPGTNLRVKLWAELRPLMSYDHTSDARRLNVDFIAPGTRRKFVAYLSLTSEERLAVLRAEKWLLVTMDLTYDSRFTKDIHLCERRASFGQDFLKAFWIPNSAHMEAAAAKQPDLFEGEAEQER